MSVTRFDISGYDFDFDISGCDFDIAEDTEGEWVRYVDHAAALTAANARADAAEAALAAQIDHTRIKPIACAPEDIAILVGPENGGADDWQVSWWMSSEGRWANWNWSTPPHQWAPMPNRNQPHDRTALERLIAKAEADAMRRAADMTLGLSTARACRTAILAMIPKGESHD